MRLGIIGCGAIARRTHLPAFAAIDGVELVAFASRSRSSADAAAAQCGAGEVMDGWEALLRRDDLDAVDICAPNSWHAPMTVAAAERSLHVLVEKPMATTVEDADRMMAAASANRVVLMPAQNLRFAAPCAAARQAVQAGRIGTVVGVRSAFGHGGPRDWAPEATWFFDPELAGGGALLDLGIHMIDVLRAVLGEEVVEVAAMIDRAPYGTDQASQVVLRFAGGAIGTLHASWVARPGPDIQLSIFGTEGRLHLDSKTPLTLFPLTGEPEKLRFEGTADSPFAAFVRAVESGEPPAVAAADGRAAVAVVEAAYQSARSAALVKPEPPGGTAA